MNIPKNKKTISLMDEQASIELAKSIAKCLDSSLVMTFSGDLGAGKTTIIRAILRELGIKGTIKSPTYSIVESYSTKDLHIHHFDLYRINEEDELEYIGFRDYFSDEAICLIEWPEKAKEALSKVDIAFDIKMEGDGRLLTMDSLTASGKRLLKCLVGEQ